MINAGGALWSKWVSARRAEPIRCEQSSSVVGYPRNQSECAMHVAGDWFIQGRVAGSYHSGSWGSWTRRVRSSIRRLSGRKVQCIVIQTSFTKTTHCTFLPLNRLIELLTLRVQL